MGSKLGDLEGKTKQTWEKSRAAIEKSEDTREKCRLIRAELDAMPHDEVLDDDILACIRDVETASHSDAAAVMNQVKDGSLRETGEGRELVKGEGTRLHGANEQVLAHFGGMERISSFARSALERGRKNAGDANATIEKLMEQAEGAYAEATKTFQDNSSAIDRLLRG